jgi:hypothetical protein
MTDPTGMLTTSQVTSVLKAVMSGAVSVASAISVVNSVKNVVASAVSKTTESIVDSTVERYSGGSSVGSKVVNTLTKTSTPAYIAGAVGLTAAGGAAALYVGGTYLGIQALRTAASTCWWFCDEVNKISPTVTETGTKLIESNGFNFSQGYYERLWENGRTAPGFRAEAILNSASKIVPDPEGMVGFMKYTSETAFSKPWSMIMNPTTMEVWHISP